MSTRSSTKTARGNATPKWFLTEYDYSIGNTSWMLNAVDPDEKLLLELLRAGQK